MFTPLTFNHDIFIFSCVFKKVLSQNALCCVFQFGCCSRDCGLSVCTQNNSSILLNARPNAVVFGGCLFELQHIIVESLSAEILEEIESLLLQSFSMIAKFLHLNHLCQHRNLHKKDWAKYPCHHKWGFHYFQHLGSHLFSCSRSNRLVSLCYLLKIG